MAGWRPSRDPAPLCGEPHINAWTRWAGSASLSSLRHRSSPADRRTKALPPGVGRSV
jgi:hypothetical protein